MKIIVHPGTGTIISADECLVIDSEKLSTEDHDALLAALEEDDDTEVIAIAARAGDVALAE